MASSRQTADSPPPPPLSPSRSLSQAGWHLDLTEGRRKGGSQRKDSPLKRDKGSFSPLRRHDPVNAIWNQNGRELPCHPYGGGGREEAVVFLWCGQEPFSMAYGSLFIVIQKNHKKMQEPWGYFFLFPINLSQLECCTKTKLTLIWNPSSFILIGVLTVPYCIHYIIFTLDSNWAALTYLIIKKKIKILYRSPKNIHRDSNLATLCNHSHLKLNICTSSEHKRGYKTFIFPYRIQWMSFAGLFFH